MEIDALVAPLRADVVGGASEVARTAADVVSRVADEAPRRGVDAFRRLLGELSVRILGAQPAMAPLVALTARALRSAEAADDEAAARAAVRREADDFRTGLDAATEAVAGRAAEALAGRDRILTLSASSTVRAALERTAANGRTEVICLESRPMSEGRRLARRLAEAGVPVTYAVDAAVSALMPVCDQVLLGADSLGDAGVVNKVGSGAAVLAARRHGVPVHVLADLTKLVPPGFPQLVDDDRPEDEVWRAPPGVRVWNRYFERVPLELVDAVVTEKGRLTPEEVDAHRSRIPVPAPLQDWARRTTP